MSKGERDHIKAYSLQRGRKRNRWRKRKREREVITSKAPDAWYSRGEKSHVFKRGKTCLCYSYDLFCSDFCFPMFSHYPIQDSGGERLLGKEIYEFIAYLYLLGTCLYQIEYSVLTHYMSSQSWYSCGFFCLLWLVLVSVLSNLVCSGSFPPKPTQDHKVSICITLMCMRTSC